VLSTRFMYPFHADPDDYYRFTDHGLQQLLQPFQRVEITALGNRLHVWWSAATEFPLVSRFFRILNPLLSRVHVSSTRWADGYLAIARRDETSPYGELTNPAGGLTR
jgi:hypothetical protein